MSTLGPSNLFHLLIMSVGMCGCEYGGGRCVCVGGGGGEGGYFAHRGCIAKAKICGTCMSGVCVELDEEWYHKIRTIATHTNTCTHPIK